MIRDFYPSGSVRVLLPTDRVTPATRAALETRLAPQGNAPQFFDQAAFATLAAACARLLPQPDRTTPIPMASLIDARLARGESDGWRYASLPPDGEAYRCGILGLDESAQLLTSTSFVALDAAGQDHVLRALQSGAAPGETWKTLPAARFFEEFLAEITECYYSHPLAQEEIGYVGMADAQGWRRIGLNEREAWEPPARLGAIREDTDEESTDGRG